MSKMGTWGPGNLENDYALDELADRSSKLVKTLLERAKRKESREGDEYDYTTLFVEFEIVFALEAKGLLHCSSSTLPTADEVEALKRDFVAAWEPYYRQLTTSDEALNARRRVILTTFNRFKRICVKHHESD